MRNRLIALLIAALTALSLSACANTVEGLEEDANENIDEAQQELQEEDGEG